MSLLTLDLVHKAVCSISILRNWRKTKAQPIMGLLKQVQEIFNSRVGKIISNQLLSIIFIEEKSVFTRKAIINVPFYVIMLLRREKVVGGIPDVKCRK